MRRHQDLARRPSPTFLVRSIVHYTDSRSFGGAEQALLILIESLDRHAWQSTLLYGDTPGISPLPQRARELGATVRSVPEIPYSLYGARYIPGFVHELRRARPAVFHAHLSWPFAAKYGRVAALLAHIPAVVATLQLFPDFRIRRSSAIQERLIAARVGRYIAVSHEIAQQVTERLHWPAHKIEVIHNAVQIERFGHPADSALRAALSGGGRPILLTMARLDVQKGLDVLLRALAHVPEAQLVLAGDGPERAALEAQASALRLGDRVLFLGHRTDVSELLAASDVFVLPSLYEGSSLAVLEAMAAMRPVVSTSIGGTEELIVHGESGLLVPPANPDALALALRRLLASPQLRTELAERARLRVEQRFSASAMAERVSLVYENLLRAAGS
jgi:glycosyltransferase involved in cell wall biosynthesis